MNSSSCRFDPRPPNSHNCLESRLQEAGLAKGRRYGSSQNTRKVERLSGRSPNDAVGNRRKLRKQRYDGWRSVLERGRNHSPFSESAGPAATNVCPRCNTQLSSWPPVELHGYGFSRPNATPPEAGTPNSDGARIGLSREAHCSGVAVSNLWLDSTATAELTPSATA
jgi:hypothetical protein